MEIVWSDLEMMCSWNMLSEVVRKMFLTWVPMNSELFCVTWSTFQKYCISMDPEHCFLKCHLHFQCWWNCLGGLVWGVGEVPFLQGRDGWFCHFWHWQKAWQVLLQPLKQWQIAGGSENVNWSIQFYWLFVPKKKCRAAQNVASGVPRYKASR